MANKPTKKQPKSIPTYQPDFSMRPSPGRLYAQKMIKLHSRYARSHIRVITRAKALYGVILFSAYFVGHVLYIIASRHSFTDITGGSLSTANAALLVAASGYFLVAKDQNTTTLILKLLMTLTGVQFFIGAFAYGSLILTLLSVGMQYYAYTQVSALKYGGL
jgi:hypothetical protein